MTRPMRGSNSSLPLWLSAMFLCSASSTLLSQGIVHPWHVSDNGGGISNAGGMTLLGSTGQAMAGSSAASGTLITHGYIPGIGSLPAGGSSVAYSVNGGWNMISVPLIAND